MTPDIWIDRVIERHTRTMTRPEFLKAVRALSARYVEQRAVLRDRSPLDSAGKRAAFAGFYAPLHFLTVRQIIESVGLARRSIETIVDLGCGTGAGGAAWALAGDTPARVVGVDLNKWALDEARWNLDALGIRARTKRGHLVAALEDLASRPEPHSGVILAWSLNELGEPDRGRAIDLIISISVARTIPVAVIEPIATKLMPWWPSFAGRVASAGGRVDEWKFDAPLPPALADLDEAAGFHRESLSARSALFGVS
jgi:SAM-dependent methyltransferase